MSLINKENLLAAQDLYLNRLEILKQKIRQTVQQELQTGGNKKEMILQNLDEIEQELDGIDECLSVLKYLYRN